MNKYPNINIPATPKQIKYLFRLTKVQYEENQLNKYDAWVKIQDILRKRGDPNIKSQTKPTLIEFLDVDKLNNITTQLFDLSKVLEINEYSNDYIDSLFGIVKIELELDIEIKLLMDIQDAKDYIEIILQRKLDKHFRDKYSLGVIFIQNIDYLLAVYSLIKSYYQEYHPNIQFKILSNKK